MRVLPTIHCSPDKCKEYYFEIFRTKYLSDIRKTCVGLNARLLSDNSNTYVLKASAMEVYNVDLASAMSSWY